MNLKSKVAVALLAGVTLVSAGGVIHVKQSEGLVYVSYPDPATKADPWTICYGHTGPEVKPGMKVTQAQCDKWLYEDIREAEYYVQRYVNVPLSQGEYDAYVSFVFNVGPGNFADSTMLRLLNSGDRVAACKQFPRWIYANKKVLNGLKVRRYEEQRMCLSFGKVVYNGR